MTTPTQEQMPLIAIPPEQSLTERLARLLGQGIVPVDVPAGELPEEARAYIANWLRSNTDIDRDICFSYALQDVIGTQWTVVRGKFAGTLPKRIASYLYKTYQIRLAPKVIESLGNVARPFIENAPRFFIDFDQAFDWDAGDYGDDGSCYWGGRSGAREMLKYHDAYAIRFYGSGNERTDHDTCTCDDCRRRRMEREAQRAEAMIKNGVRTNEDIDLDDLVGIGRAWVIPNEIDNALILFNCYGPYQLQTAARVLSILLNVPSYKRISLSCRGDTCGTLYINSGTAFLVGSPETIDSISHHDLNWRDSDRPGSIGECIHCDTNIFESDNYITLPDGDLVCEDHMYYYSHCQHCDSYLRDAHHDFVTVYRRVGGTFDYDAWCEDCREEVGTEVCPHCTSTWIASDMIDHPTHGRTCPQCSANLVPCDDCGTTTHRRRLNRITNLNRLVCNACYSAYTVCSDPYCANILKRENMVQTERGLVCPDCVENYVPCDDCGTLIHRRRLQSLGNLNRHVCSRCAYNYSVCREPSCSNICRDTDMVRTANGLVCPDCAVYYAPCPSCGELYHAQRDFSDGTTMCRDCHYRRIANR